MLEFEVVDHASIFPMNCAVCQSQKPPFIDTFSENPVGRIYLCKSCARRAARQFGFAPGKRLDELADASTALEAKQAEVAALLEEITALRMENGAERAALKSLKAQLDHASGTRQQIEHLAATLERGARELVEAVATRPLEAAV
jgi:hypothetical protein